MKKLYSLKNNKKPFIVFLQICNIIKLDNIRLIKKGQGDYEEEKTV